MTRPQDVSAEQHCDHPSIGSEIPRLQRVGDGDRAVVRSSVATAVPEGFESIEDVFENSYCHSLALALHERTAADVHDHGIGAHRAEGSGPDNAGGLTRQRQ